MLETSMKIKENMPVEQRTVCMAQWCWTNLFCCSAFLQLIHSYLVTEVSSQVVGLFLVLLVAIPYTLLILFWRLSEITNWASFAARVVEVVSCLGTLGSKVGLLICRLTNIPSINAANFWAGRFEWRLPKSKTDKNLVFLHMRGYHSYTEKKNK
jgi:hypothetical protein